MWREGLLARAVLSDATLGYRNHPQLIRFRAQPDPLRALDAYLTGVLDESLVRDYRFSAHKIRRVEEVGFMEETRGQMAFERAHLLAKLRVRDQGRWQALLDMDQPEPNPVFRLKDGPVRDWERGITPNDGPFPASTR